MNDFINWFTKIISELGNWSYALLALICFLEALPIVGFFIPMVIALLLAGFLVTTNSFNFSSLLIICSLAAVLGDFIAFILGHYFAKSFKKEHKILKDEYLAKASAFMQRRGILSLFWGRFIGPIRPMICFVAGTTKLSWDKFVYPVVASSFLFVLFYLSIGYLMGNAWQTMTSWASRLGVIVTSLVIIILFLWWLAGFIFRSGQQLASIVVSLTKTFYNYFLNTKLWHRFANKFSNLSALINKRINPNNFFGLALSLLVFLEIIFLIIIIYFSFNLNLVSGFDLRVYNFINLFAEAHLATVFFGLTTLASGLLIAAISLLVVVWLFLEKRWSYILGLLVSVVGSFLGSSLIKYLVARPRPTATFYFENSYAFVSSHAALATGLFLFLAYYAIRAYPRWSRNVSLVFLTFCFILLIGFSRIYLGVHYLSDVLGGYLVGLFFFILGVILSRYTQNNDQPQRLKKPKQIGWLISYVLIIGLVFGLQIFKQDTLSLFKHYSPDNIKINNHFNVNSLNLVSENLGGNHWRPLEFILVGQDQVIKEALHQSGWTERKEANLLTLIKRGLALTFKQPFVEAPLKPRYWRNQINDLTFTKDYQVNKKRLIYVLRLWTLTNDQGEPQYLGEISVNRGLTFNFTDKEIITKQAVDELIKDLESSTYFSNFSTMKAEAKLNEEAKQKSSFLVNIFTFK